MAKPSADHLSAFAGQSILVTGGAGAIGSNLVRRLADLQAHSIVILDDLSAASRWNVPELSGVEFVEGSVSDDGALRRAFAKKPKIVFHLAAFFANQNSVEHPRADLNTNGLGTLMLLEHARRAELTRFVYASSGCSIYGDGAELPLREGGMSLHLRTPYQITKMLGELYGNYFHDHYDVPVVRARLFNSYGPGEVPGQFRNVIPNFVYWAMKGRPLPITGEGAETRDFTFVGDIVDGLLRAAVYPAAVGQAMNLASGAETSILQLAETINHLTGNPGGVEFRPARSWDTKKRLWAACDLAASLIDYQPRTTIEDGLSATVSWFRRYWSEIQASASFPAQM